HFFAVEHVLAALFQSAGEHAARVGAELRFGEAEAADGFSLLKKRQPSVFLGIAAEGVDGVHYQGALHGDKAAQAGITTFEFLGDQAVGNIGHSGATVALEIGSEESKLSELRHEMNGEGGF